MKRGLTSQPPTSVRVVRCGGSGHATVTTTRRAIATKGQPKSKTAAVPPKPYWEMTTAELREATKEFDQEFIGDTFGPPTAEQRAQDRRARRKRGRPRNGLGSKTISVTVEKRLLAETDRLAKKLHLPRAALIARGLQAVVGQEVPIR